MQGVKVKESKIAGLGLFTDQEFNEGDFIGIAHINGQPSPMIGKYHNHSDNPNAHSILLGNKRYIAALRPLKKGEEITVDYRKQPELEQPEEFAKGGLVSMPKASKKGLASKRYTKDLTGTNRLFTKNALLKKPKSKKNRVYNPNAKYYAEGGESETEVVPEMPTPDPGNAISSAPTFNAAFKIARSTYGPNHIFEYQGRKYGTNLIGEAFKPSEDVLAQAGLNTPSVKENLNKQNSDLNDPYASKSTVKLEPDSYKSWDEIKQKNLELNTSANADKIINYKNNIGGDKNYIIVDKKKGLMHVYEPGNSKPLFTSPVDLGATESDAQTVTKIKDTNGDGKIDSKEAQVGAADFDKGNKSTGAGKYYISNIDPEGYGGLPLFNMMNESQYENFLKTGKVNNVATSIHKGFIPDDNSRVSNGCIRCNKTTLSNLTKYLENSSEVYILPEDPNNEFIIENDKLNFKVKNKSPYYTYKNNGKVYKKENGAWYIAPKMGEQFVKITEIDRIKELNKNATNARYNFYEDAKGNVQKGQGVNLGSTLNYVPIKAKLDKEKFVNDKFTYFDFSDDKELEVVNKFVSSLEQNKQKAMKVAKINGDVYNDIAQIAFGIFGTESNFADTHSAVGNLARAAQKYFDPKGSSSPDYQSKYSTYGAKEDSRSVGLTQIRWNYLSADEKKALKSVGITSNADFMEPAKAALGTTVILGIRYNQQLTDKQKKDIWTTLPKTWNTRDNYASRVLDNSKYLTLEQKVTDKNSATKKDKWGRPATSKWYGFNPKTKKYEYQNGGIISQEEIDAGNNAMMKARLAYAQMHGNPAAQRMVVAPDQPYDFGDGMIGTHYMASMDNYAVPQIQDINGQLMLGDYGPESMESIRFDNPEDAEYFAEHYKEITPDASYRKDKYPDGGLVEVRGYEGNKFRKNANGKWEYESGRPVEDPLLIQKLTYESKPVGSPVIQGAPKPVINQTVWENAAGTSQKNAIAREKQLQGLKNSVVLADQEKAAQIEWERSRAAAAQQAAQDAKWRNEQPLDMMDWLWGAAAVGPTIAPAAWAAAETAGTAAMPYINAAFNTIPGQLATSGFAADAIVNRLYPSAGKIQEGKYGEAATDIATGLLDVAGANMLSPMYKGAKATASELGKFLGTEEGLLSNAYKVNPFAFKPQEGMMYRGLGQEGFTDAMQSGVFRPKQLGYSPERSFTEIVSNPKQFESTFYAPSDKFGIVKGYGPKYVAEVPFEGNQFNRRYKGKNWSWSTPREIPIEEGRILQKDWSRGYKEVPKELPGSPNTFKSEIDWAKWNPDTPNYPELINEYNAIEESTKANGTWMKNPDGSSFKGSPEQFIQQNSSWFKKAFGDSKLINPDGSPTIQYHGSAKKFDTFDESKFQLGDAGYSGRGIYTSPSKTSANSYALSSAKFHKGDIEPTVYELYGQANNPISSSQLINENKGRDLFNFYRDNNWQGDLSPYESLREYDAAISDQLTGVQNIRPWHDAREVVFPTNKQLKSAIGNVGFFDMTNPNIYKSILPYIIPTGLGVGAASQMQGQELNEEYQKGGAAVNGDEPKRKKTKFQPGTYDPNETAGYMLDEQEVVVPGKASNWGKAAIAYEKRNSEEGFVDKKKKQYLKKNKGLNELYGVNMENFPQEVEQNFRNEYDYNKNTAVVKKVGKQEGWNPNRRTQYVGDLNDIQRGVVAESKYGSKLQPSYWDRTLAGLATFASNFSPDLRAEMNQGIMPGLTQKESQEILNRKIAGIPIGGLESFAALEIPGTIPANILKNTGLSTGSSYKEMPSWYSGEKMANVTDADVTALNPLTYAGLEAIPELGINLAKGAYKAGSAGVDLVKTNPQAWFKTPEQILETPGLYSSAMGRTSWKDPVGKLNKFVDDVKIKSSLKRENALLDKYPGFENRNTRIPLQQEEQLKRLEIEKAIEERNLRRTKLPIKQVLTEQGTKLGGGQGRIFVNTLNPDEVVKIGTFPGGSEDLANLVQAGKNLEGMPLMENVAFPTKAFTLKTPKVKGNTVIRSNSDAVQFMPWKGNPLDVNNPINKPLGFGVPSDKAKRELQYMAELLDENKVGIDYFGQNNMMYDPATDSYKLVDLNYVDDPKKAWEWNKLDKPVKQRIEDKFGYEIPQGELPLKLEFANSKSIKPMLGDKIGDNTGKFNLGVYNFKDYPQYIAKVEDPASVAATQGLDAEQYMNAMVERTKNLDPSQFAKVLKNVEGKEGKRVLVMPKLRGTLGSKLDTDLLQSIPDQSYENFYNNLKLLRDEGLNYDFLGDNFMYDPYTEQFNIFDLSPQSNITVEPTSGNEHFFETEVFGKGNPGIYGKEQAGENLKDAMRKKLTRTYMETFPGDQEMYGLDEYSQRIDAILKGLSPQRFGGTNNSKLNKFIQSIHF
jgi:hypothetical protein